MKSWKQDAPPTVFTYSYKDPDTKKRKNKTLQERSDNLKTLAKKAAERETFTTDDIPELVGKKISHLFAVDTVDEWWIGQVISQVIL